MGGCQIRKLFWFLALFSNAFSGECFIQTDEIELYCREFGQGEAIIVVHGGPGLSHDYLLPGMLALEQNHRLIFYDQRSSGRSRGVFNRDKMEMEVFIEDLDAVRRAFNLDQVIILGHSWGGLVAMNYAIAYPDRVKGLILLNTMGGSLEEFMLFEEEVWRRVMPHKERLETIFASKAFVEGDPVLFEEFLQLVLSSYCFCPKSAFLLNLRMSQEACANYAHPAMLGMPFKPFDIHDHLKTLTCPTLIVHGDCDPVSEAAVRRLHQEVVGSQFVLLKNCGHFAYVEEPDQLFHYLKEFLLF